MQLGLRACPCGDVTFDGVETPGAALPASTVARIWSNAEALVAAIRAGILRAAQRTSADYALERWQGGKVIIGHSLVRKMLADIAQESEIADALWPDLCAAVSPTGLPPRLVARSLDVAEGLPGVVSQCLQLLGGSGYTEDLPQARRFRDAKQCEFLLGHPQARRWAMAYRASGSGLTTIATRDPVSPEPAGVHGQVPKHA
jgi:alkylation response protein AidB-like acyl-CoA dehydrogenase